MSVLSSFANQFSTGGHACKVKAKFGSNAGVTALAVTAVMVAIVSLTVFTGKLVAFTSIPFLVLAVLLLSNKNRVSGLAVYLLYGGLEGMFKYLSGFSQVIYAIRPIMASLLVFTWVFVMIHVQKRQISTPALGIMAAMMLWGAVEVLNPFGDGVASGITCLIDWYGIPFALFAYTRNITRSASDANTIIMGLCGISTMISLFAVIQFQMGEGWTNSHLPGYALVTAHNWWTKDARGAVTGTTWSPASTTSYSGIACMWSQLGIVTCITYLISPRIMAWIKILLLFALLVNVVGLQMEASRMWVLIAIIETVLIMAITARTVKRLMLNLGLLCVLSVIVWTGIVTAQVLSNGMSSQHYAATLEDPTGKFESDRGYNLDYLQPFLIARPFGVGFQRGDDSYANSRDSNPVIVTNRETEFNAVSDDMGIPGLIFIAVIMIVLARAGWNSYSRIQDSQLRVLAAGCFVIFVGELISFLGTPVLQGNDSLFILLGTLVALPGIDKRLREERPSQSLLPEVVRP